MEVSSVKPHPKGAAVGIRIDRAVVERKCRLALESIRNSYGGEHSLLCPHARRDGGDHARCHLELILAVLDSVPPSDPVKISIGSPHLAFLALIDQKPHRPVEPGIGICRDELRAEWRVSENQQHRWSEFDARIRCQLGLIDLIEKPDTFVGDVLLQALNSLSDWIGAFQ